MDRHRRERARANDGHSTKWGGGKEGCGGEATGGGGGGGRGRGVERERR